MALGIESIVTENGSLYQAWRPKTASGFISFFPVLAEREGAWAVEEGSPV
jgi:hypothetical protein